MSQAAAPLPESMLSSGLTRRHTPSPYHRSPSAYSNLGPATSPHDLMRIQAEFAQDLSNSTPTLGPSGGFMSSKSPMTSPPMMSDWDRGQVSPYYSPPPGFQLQQLASDGSQQSDLPKYHFSLSSSGAGPVGGITTALHPSAPRQVDEVMKRLKMNQNDLRCCAATVLLTMNHLRLRC